MHMALMDCNNFYASCEKAFAPHLAARPVVVLSNNDGCIVARSREAKELGVPMGAPEFKCRALLARHNVAVFSSNYALYGDMSARVMATAAALAPRMEVYSIDEAFLDFTGLPGGPEEAARRVREAVKRATGIPVSIGVGPTKTLAKAANKLAKKDAALGGALVLPEDPAGREDWLARLDVEDIWGVGPRHAKRLRGRGARSALDFIRLPRDYVRKTMTTAGLHTWLELRGAPCIPLERAPRPKKSIVSSRSFGVPVEALVHMREAASYHAARAAEKLRAQNGQAAQVTLWVQTNAFIQGEPQYSGVESRALSPPTSRADEIVRSALTLLGRLFRPGYRYKKTGVMLSGIESAESSQLSLLRGHDERGGKLMEVLDRVNAKWGRETLFPAACGVERAWRMRMARRSPRYTTAWEELPVARAWGEG
jgi:DNA polymerase V